MCVPHLFFVRTTHTFLLSSDFTPKLQLLGYIELGVLESQQRIDTFFRREQSIWFKFALGIVK